MSNIYAHPGRAGSHSPIGLVTAVVFSLAILGFSGCTDLTPYRSRVVSVSAGLVTSRTDGITNNPLIVTNLPLDDGSHVSYVLSVIEFDDEGEMWDRNELTDAMDAIKEQKSKGLPVTLIIFAHGWDNDASGNTDNLNGFKKFIESFARVDPGLGASSIRHRVVGVFLAWRGKSATSEYLHPFTFWGRKNAAERVAGVASTEAIDSLIAEARFGVGNEQDDSKVIVVGHSFGGLIVEKAVTQAMLGAMLLNAPSDETRREKRQETEDRESFDLSSINDISNRLAGLDWRETDDRRIYVDRQSSNAQQLYAGWTNQIAASNRVLANLSVEIEKKRQAIASNWQVILGTDHREYRFLSEPDYEQSLLYKIAKDGKTYDLNLFAGYDWRLISLLLDNLKHTNEFSGTVDALAVWASYYNSNITNGADYEMIRNEENELQICIAQLKGFINTTNDAIVQREIALEHFK